MALPDHLQTLQPSLFLLLRSVADMAAVNMSSAYADALVVWSTCVHYFPGLTLPPSAVTSMIRPSWPYLSRRRTRTILLSKHWF